MPTHANIPDERTTYVELDIWLWASYEDAARGSGEPKGTTEEMARWKLSHEETAGIQALEIFCTALFRI